MMYTPTRPAEQGDRILLFPDPLAARAALGEGLTLFGVAVQFDWRGRRVAALGPDARGIDPTWSTPAEAHADGSATARGPIPSLLFVD
jgi:hypothetical protein